MNRYWILSAILSGFTGFVVMEEQQELSLYLVQRRFSVFSLLVRHLYVRSAS